MNIERKNIDEVNAIITLHVEKSDYQEKVEKTLKDYAKKANVPGFRPGKVPASMIKKMYGKQVLGETINQVLGEKLYGYIKDNDIQVLGEPLPSESQSPINFDLQEEFDFVFDVAIAPEFSLDLNKRISVPQYEIMVDDTMVDNAVKSHTARFGEYKEVDEVVETDVVKGDIVELVDGKEGELKVESVVLCPKYMKNEEQKSLFAGVKKGQPVVFNPKTAFENEAEIASFLKMTKEQAANITSDFQMTITGITRHVEAELNQELFDKAFGEGVVKSEEEFKNKIKEDLKSSLSIDSDYKLLLDVRDTLVKKLDGLVFPDDFLKRWVLATNEKMTQEELDKNYADMIKDLKWHLIKEKIVKANEIKVGDDDLMNFAKKAAKAQFAQYGMMSIPEEYLEDYAKNMLKNKDAVKNMVDKVVEEKVLAVVKSSVKLNLKEVSLDEFNKMFE